MHPVRRGDAREDAAAIGARVIGEQPLHAYPTSQEVLERAKGSAAERALVAQRLPICVAAVVVDRDMQVLHAPGALGTRTVAKPRAQRLPPPSGILPCFFTSICSSSPAAAVCTADLTGDATRSRRRLRSARRSTT